MPLILLTGKAIAEMIPGKTYEQTGLPRVWKTSQERLDSERNDILSPLEPAQAKLWRLTIDSRAIAEKESSAYEVLVKMQSS